MISLLRLAEVKRRTGLSRSTIYLFMARGEFPHSIRLGARAVAWNSESVDAWIERRIEDDRSKKVAR